MKPTATVRYQGSLRTTATHHRSGQTLITDAPIDNQGKGEAFSPTDLCATSLASCILTIMGIRARDAGIDMTGAEAALEKVMVNDPDRRIGSILIQITMPAHDFSPEQRQLLTEASQACPVCRSLSPAVQISVDLHWPKP